MCGWACDRGGGGAAGAWIDGRAATERPVLYHCR